MRSWMKHYCEQIIFLTCDAFPRSHRACFGRKIYRLPVHRDVIAGITVRDCAIPLAMALAVAVALRRTVWPLYLRFVAGIVIALAGGSRF